MRFLANENIPKEVVQSLRDEGHDVTWVREFAPGLVDHAILALAQSEKRVILTFDKDFGELAFQRGLPASSGIILLRVTKSLPAKIASIVVPTINERTDWVGHFSVIDDQRIRMTRLRSRYHGP